MVGTFNIIGHPDGGLYFPGVPVSPQYAIMRLDPVAAAVTTFVPAQSQFGYLGIAVVQGFHGCPTETQRSTWGCLKAMYR